MLAMGLGLCDDLDAIVKAVSRQRQESRKLSEDEEKEIRQAAIAALGWGGYDGGEARDASGW